MNSQITHDIAKSFYLWFDDMLTRVGGAYTSSSQSYVYADRKDTPSGYNSYFTSDGQTVANSTGNIDEVTVNGTGIGGSLTGAVSLLIDHYNGRIIINNSVGQSATITSNFKKKTINLYRTDKTEEYLLLNEELAVNGDAFLDALNRRENISYTLPAVFITSPKIQNKDFSIGGMEDSVFYIRCIVIANDEYELDFVLGLFADTKDYGFKKISGNANWPFGNYWSIKDTPYSYLTHINSVGSDYIHINEAVASKLGDKPKISKDRHIGFINFELSLPREPREAFRNVAEI